MLKQIVIMVFVIFIFSACKPPKQPTEHSIIPQCIASQSTCFVETPTGRFDVKFNFDQITSEVEFNIHVVYQGKEKLKSLNGYIEGKNMFMGKIPLFFTESTKINHYVAPTMLASCSENEMTWKLWFTVEYLDELGDSDSINKTKLNNQRFFIEFDSVE